MSIPLLSRSTSRRRTTISTMMSPPPPTTPEPDSSSSSQHTHSHSLSHSQSHSQLNAHNAPTLAQSSSAYMSLLQQHHQQQQQSQSQSHSHKQQHQQQQHQQHQSKQSEDKPYAWRMQPKAEPKYQLFPKKPTTLAIAPTSTPCSAALTSNPPPLPSDKPDKAPSSGLRLRMKEHSIIRRRKVSVPDIGPPMTTVQELSMDSPTIPGRPPLHERSTSAPGTSMKHHHLVDCMIQPVYDKIPEQSVYLSFEDLVGSPIELPRCSSAQAVLSPTVSAMANPPSPNEPSPGAAVRHAHSSRALRPLVIPPISAHSQSQPSTAAAAPPSNNGNGHSYSHSVSSTSHSHNNNSSHQLPTSYLNALRPSASATTPLSAQIQSYSSRFRSGTAPSSDGMRSARSDASPQTRTPYTPLSAISAASAMFTPVSAATSADTNYTMADFKESLATFGTTTTTTTTTTSSSEPPEQPRGPTPVGVAARVANNHRRDQSDSGSIMERGRPRKRSASREGAASPAISAMVAAGHTGTGTTASCQRKGSLDSSSPAPTAAAGTSVTCSNNSCSNNSNNNNMSSAASIAPSSASLKGACSKSSLKSAAAERRAFEVLPRGYKASEAPAYLPAGDIAALATQALQQAGRFEVLCRKDVESLSRELRSLDERCEYLRRTYTSLRTGRRNLHGRICQYLRSPRVAKFSHESMLKQEEALAELDTSIDDWVLKLEKADNRRTRVRQKLLEHVAAAVTMPMSSSVAAEAVKAAASCGSGSGGSSPIGDMAGVSESLHLAMGFSGQAPAGSSSSGCSANQQAMATPPRSPTKSAFASASAHSPGGYQSTMASPQRPAAAQVPSTILEQPLVEEAMAMIAKSEAEAAAAAAAAAEATAAAKSASKSESKPAADRPSSINTTAVLDDAESAIIPHSPTSPISTYESYTSSRRADVESIRIYASDDVYTLLADVESQIADMGTTPTIPFATPASAPVAAKTTTEGFAHHRHSRIFDTRRMHNHSTSGSKRGSPSPPASPDLSGSGSSSGSKTNASNSSASSPTDDGEEIFLTSAVFHPERSMLVM